MADLIVEISSEEIPARMQSPALKAMRSELQNLLQGAGLTYGKLSLFITPRRIALHVTDLPEKQDNQQIEKKGPSVNAPDQAIQGFMRAQGLADVSALEVRDSPKGQQYWAVHEKKGEYTKEVLPALLNQWIDGHRWPKSMRMASMQFRWVRPLQSVMALFDGEKLNGKIRLDDDHYLEFQDHCYGHAMMSPQKINPMNFADYLQALEENYVILDQQQRYDMIVKQARALSATVGGELVEDEGLLDELSGLVEWPKALLGKIDEGFMALPANVLYASMKGHQKYLAIRQKTTDRKEALTPYFIVISNRAPKDGGQNIIQGNERVLRARLDDARFFFEQDQKNPLMEYQGQLERRIFHAKLGHLGQKANRLEMITAFIIRTLKIQNPEIKESEEDAIRAARLAKCDLATQMVGEFPELQGKMGTIYARLNDEKEAICNAIGEHYAPLGPQATTPSAPLSMALALADKLDALMGFFLIDERPTGSKDPYALRRSALGIIRIIIENNLGLHLGELLGVTISAYEKHSPVDKEAKNISIIDDIKTFIKDRLQVYYKDQEFLHNEVMAVLNHPHNRLIITHRKLISLHNFMKTEQAQDLILLYKRAYNILKAENISIYGTYKFDNNIFKKPQEETLCTAFMELNIKFPNQEKPTIESIEFYQNQLNHYLNLKQPMADFFDHVTVNDENKKLRDNRLQILKAVTLSFNNLVDFSEFL